MGGAGEGEGKPREGGRGGWSGAGAGGRIAIGVIGLDACGVIASSCRPGRGALSPLRLRPVLGAMGTEDAACCGECCGLCGVGCLGGTPVPEPSHGALISQLWALFPGKRTPQPKPGRLCLLSCYASSNRINSVLAITSQAPVAMKITSSISLLSSGVRVSFSSISINKSMRYFFTVLPSCGLCRVTTTLHPFSTASFHPSLRLPQP